MANAAGMIAKYFATSLAMLKVVSAPRVISICLPISTISINLVGIRIEIDHVASFLGGLRAGIHGDAHVGLGQCRRVVGAVAGHGDELSAGLCSRISASLFSGVASARNSSTPLRRRSRRPSADCRR